jgi:hypothetical protein
MNAPRDDWPKRKKQTSKIRATRRGANAAMDDHTVTGPNAKKQPLQNSCDPAQRRSAAMDRAPLDVKRKKQE